MTRHGKLAHAIGLAIVSAAVLSLLAGAAVAQQQGRRDTPAAQPKKEIPPVAAGASPAAAPSQGAPVANITGFRSAKFGMNESEVRAAIVRDLGVKADAIKSEVNPSEQTPVL